MNIHIGWVVFILIAIAALYIYKHKPMTTS